MEQTTTIGLRGQKIGGVAALYLALAFFAAIPYFLLVVDYQGATTAADKVKLVTGHYASLYAMYLVTYVFFGLGLGALALSLHERFRDAAPFAARLATASGLLWACMLVASGLVFDYGMTTIVDPGRTDPAGASAAWQAIEPVAQGLGGAGGELLGGLWVFGISVLGLRTRALPGPLCLFGAAIGILGLASVVPPLRDGAVAFGLLLVVWFAWLGAVMLRLASLGGAKGATRL